MGRIRLGSGRRKPRGGRAAASEGRGRLHFRSPSLHQPPRLRACGLPYVTHGQIFPRARGRRFPGPVVHPRVAVPPQRCSCSWLSTGKRADHDVATGDPEPRPLVGWQLFCSATGSKEGSLQTLLAGPRASNPSCVQLSKEQTRPGRICKLKSMTEKKWSSIQS